jgi:menaquinol-cytochrome c reductase iron-sulfur subunit
MSSSSTRYPADDRRGFLAKTIAISAAGLACAVPACAALAAFLNPWREKGRTGGAIRITSLDALTVGGPWQQFPVVSDRTDAWTRLAAEPIGAVFLRRTGKGQVGAFQAECPHAGCLVAFDAKKNEFACPCHAARFDTEGKCLGENSMSPRDLDALDVEVRNENEVWVQFARFKTAEPEKKPLA